jgi:hypothetical protein
MVFDKIFHFRLQVIGLLVNPFEWQPTQTAVTLQRALAHIQHDAQILIVQ